MIGGIVCPCEGTVLCDRSEYSSFFERPRARVFQTMTGRNCGSVHEYLQMPMISPDIISDAVCLYYRFNLSHRDIEDLLAQRGITVSREVIRL